jgi:hypothetical protein
LKQLRGGDGSATGLQSQARERVVDDLREGLVVTDDEGEDADIKRLLDKAGEDILIGRLRPEEASKRDVDRDEDAGEPSDIALHQAEPGIDILRECREKSVDDACAAHRVYRPSGFGRAGDIGGASSAGSAGRVGLRRQSDRLTAGEFGRERIGGYRWLCDVRYWLRLANIEANSGRDDRGCDERVARGATDNADVHRPGLHQ